MLLVEGAPQSECENLDLCKGLRVVELQVTRMEAELRRAKEEQELLKELRTMNKLIIAKKERQDASQKSLKISTESLQELRAIEDEIKLENRKTEALQIASKAISNQMNAVEESLEDAELRLMVVKHSTGWDIDAASAKSGSASLNELLEQKKRLTALSKEQKTVRATTNRLTREIEDLTHIADEQESIEKKIEEAKEILAQQSQEYNELAENVKSFGRLRKKKERMLDETRDTGDYKVIRQLEGDKKVLHSNLSTLRETSVSSSKSILTLEVYLRQLETRLDAVNMFLKQVFAEVEDDEPIDGIPKDATEVSLVQFEELCHELELSRETVVQRDDQLDSHDAKVEKLEKKIEIIRNAIASRSISSHLNSREKEKEFSNLMSDVDFLKMEFEQEHKRLTAENNDLRKKIAQL